MFCTSCGKQIDNAFWCHHCGSLQKVDTNTTKPTDIASPTPRPKHREWRFSPIDWLGDHAAWVFAFLGLIMAAAAYRTAVQEGVESDSRTTWIIVWLLAYGVVVVLSLIVGGLVLLLSLAIGSRLEKEGVVGAENAVIIAISFSVGSSVWMTLLLHEYAHGLLMEWFACP